MNEKTEEKNWFQKNWLWAVPSGCLGLFLCCALTVAGIFAGVSLTIRNTEVFTDAFAILEADPRAADALGTPIEAGWLIQGNVSTEFTNGVQEGIADLTVPVSGPDGSGQLLISAQDNGGGWVYQQLELELESGETINLQQR